MSYVGKNPRFTSQILDDITTTTPSNPASGSNKIVNRNGFLFIRDSSGNETPVGSNSGELNVVVNSNTAANWVSSNASNITVATSTTSTDLPLAGIINTAIKITPISGTDYIRYRWTMPESLQNTKLKLQWYARPLSGYAAGDLHVQVYKNSASDYSGSYTEFALATDNASGLSSLPNYTGGFVTSFDADDADYYELRIVRAAGTTAYNLANVIIGPGTIIEGAAVSAPVAWTPTGTWVSNATYTGNYTRIGSWALFQVQVALTGAPTAATLNINLPSGLTIDSTNLLSSNASVVATDSSVIPGSMATFLDSGTQVYKGEVVYKTTSTVGPVAFETDAAYLESADVVNATSPFTWANGDVIEMAFMVPIAEWASDAVVNLGTNDIEYASVGGTWDAASSTVAYGPQGSIMGGALTASREKTITWQSPMQSTSRVQILFSKDRTSWFPWDEAQIGASNTPSILMRVSGTYSSGIAVRPGAAQNQSIVTFYRYLAQNPDGTSTIDWPSDAYWVAVKYRDGNAIGFGRATSTNWGLSRFGGGSYVAVSSTTGHGSTNTCIRTFGVIDHNVGTAVTYTSSATLGDSFTINVSGIYFVKFEDINTGGACISGISRNATGLLSTSIGSTSFVAYTTRLCIGTDDISRRPSNSFCGPLTAGDVIRPHTDGNGTNSGPSNFMIFLLQPFT